MKKLIAILMVAVICLSFAACRVGDIKEPSETAPTLPLSSTPIDTNPIDAMPTMPNDNNATGNCSTETTTETYEKIALTTENWDQYFEFIVIPSFSKNAFGELERFELWPYFSLKEEYVNRIVTDQTTIAVEMTYLWGECVCSVDINTMSYTLGEYTPKGQRGEDIIDQTKFTIGDTFYGCHVGGLCFLDGNELHYYYSDFEIVRIKGNLVLKTA